jgi:hypothetical protein
VKLKPPSSPTFFFLKSWNTPKSGWRNWNSATARVPAVSTGRFTLTGRVGIPTVKCVRATWVSSPTYIYLITPQKFELESNDLHRILLSFSRFPDWFSPDAFLGGDLFRLMSSSRRHTYTAPSRRGKWHAVLFSVRTLRAVIQSSCRASAAEHA